MDKTFDDYQLDEILLTRTRTITEADIVNFAGLSGDFHELHMSEEYAKRGPFGRRIAHGALVFSISTGLMIQMGASEHIIAFYGLDKLRFVKPVFIGDTLRVKKRVLELAAKDDQRGVVAFETTVLNQHDEPVIVYIDRVLVKRRG
ncbi:MAG: MaoC family dehydratase N-terminal domain-containing protein [Acidobacteria bacterium]|nr:MaoC family dehydratase N-terminal domain-containing protein [Acidobacteriota bacterium]MBI3428106.1 MaoC family dehydratase N-terminal domain-containing protein [Acidobacteriota bacterium]